MKINAKHEEERKGTILQEIWQRLRKRLKTGKQARKDIEADGIKRNVEINFQDIPKAKAEIRY